MGGQRPALHEVQELPDGLGLAGGSPHHVVGDAGELGHLIGDGPLRVHEGGKNLVGDLAVLIDHGADFGDDVMAGIQAGGLQVEADVLPVEISVQAAPDGGHVVHVVDEIGLHPEEHLDARLLGGGVGRGEVVADAVVGDGDGGVAPGRRPLDHLLDVGGGVHGGHLGM